MSVSVGDKRVKAIVAVDPWLAPYSGEIRNGKLSIKDSAQAVCFVESEDFAREIDRKVGGRSDQNGDTTHFLANCRGVKERVRLRRIPSWYSTDHVLLDSLGLSLARTWKLPYRRAADLYRLNVWLALQFLSRT